MKELALIKELSSSKKSDQGQTNDDGWEGWESHMTTESHFMSCENGTTEDLNGY